MTRLIPTLAAILCATAVNATDTSIAVNAPGVEMTVSYVPEGPVYSVVATIIEPQSAAQPMQARMKLVDGDDFTLDLPEITNMTFSFARQGNEVVLTAATKVQTAYYRERGAAPKATAYYRERGAAPKATAYYRDRSQLD